MLLLARGLMVVAAAIPLVLGVAHLVLTWRGPKLQPSDPAVTEAMRGDHVPLHPSANVWRLWVGFNASHSLGIVLYGLVFGILAIGYPDVLFGSWPLLAVAIGMPLALCLLGLRYWFRVPTTGAGISAAFAIAAVAVSQLARLAQ
jgi:hypothetical protein